MLQLQLKEAKNREQKLKEMYDSVMNAFQSSAGQVSTIDIEEERKKITSQVINEAITKDHPKVKDIIAETIQNL